MVGSAAHEGNSGCLVGMRDGGGGDGLGTGGGDHRPQPDGTDVVEEVRVEPLERILFIVEGRLKGVEVLLYPELHQRLLVDPGEVVIDTEVGVDEGAARGLLRAGLQAGVGLEAGHDGGGGGAERHSLPDGPGEEVHSVLGG